MLLSFDTTQTQTMNTNWAQIESLGLSDKKCRMETWGFCEDRPIWAQCQSRNLICPGRDYKIPIYQEPLWTSIFGVLGFLRILSLCLTVHTLSFSAKFSHDCSNPGRTPCCPSRAAEDRCISLSLCLCICIQVLDYILKRSS